MLPSEIARALKLEYEALKHQGRRTDLRKELEELLNERKTTEKSVLNADDNGVCETSGPVGGKLSNESKYDFSERNRQRYIRLTYLIPELLDMVDVNKIAVRPAVDISFLKNEEQQMLLEELKTTKFKVDMKKAALMKKLSLKRKLTSDMILQIIAGNILVEKPAKKAAAIKLPYKRISKYLDATLSQKEAEEYIIKALEFYQQNVG